MHPVSVDAHPRAHQTQGQQNKQQRPLSLSDSESAQPFLTRCRLSFSVPLSLEAVLKGCALKDCGAFFTIL